MITYQGGPDEVVATGRVDVPLLRHPTEPQRFALAVISVVSGIGVAIALTVVVGWVHVLIFGLGLGLLLGLLWISLQLLRIRILGDAVRVGPETLPAMQSAIDEVRQRLNYHKRVDIFVVPKLSPSVQLTSFFGVRVLLVEGGAVADITSPANRPQLLFLLGTYFGGLSAKHARWSPAAVIIGELGLQRILSPLLCPWLRATVYTGDRIAYACSRDLGVSLDATYRILVGRELSPQLHVDGLIAQAAGVQRSAILRFSQLFRPVPHATNRFLNLLHLAHSTDPDSVIRFRSTLTPAAATTLDTVLARITRDNQRRAGVVITASLTVAVAAFVAYAGGWLGNSAEASNHAQIGRLVASCSEGDYAACDDLYFAAEVGSDEELFGATCGNTSEALNGHCEEQAEGLLDTGDDALDQLVASCSEGDYAACDDLYFAAEVGSDEELFGATCGNTSEALNGHCEQTYG